MMEDVVFATDKELKGRATVRATTWLGLLDVTGSAYLGGTVEFAYPNGDPGIGTNGVIVQATGNVFGAFDALAGWTFASINNTVTATRTS